MSLFGWLTRRRENTAFRQWHADWETAVGTRDAEAPARLDAQLRAVPPPADDIEVEEEMLQALRDVLALERELAESRLPLIETSHRVAAGEPCHFSAPVSIPDDPQQPTGRLLLTSNRAAFAGAGRPAAIGWHATRDVVRAGRDLVLVRHADGDALRFRCNSFSDALCAAAIARHLVHAARRAKHLL